MSGSQAAARIQEMVLKRREPDRQYPTGTLESEAEEYTAFASGRVGRNPQMMIRFRKASGQTKVYAYSMLTEIDSENPDESFTLIFGVSKVVVHGQNLQRLFDYVCEHRVLEVVEADRASQMRLTHEPSIVTEIHMARA